MFDGTFKSERLWSLEKLAGALGVKKSWVYNQTYRNLIPHRRVAGKLRFDPVEIDAWIDSQPGWSLKISRTSVLRKQEEQT